ncbi:DMT family transporter [Clostridium sp. AM58-1XD]|uniref:DMT family transporter n=1 Tax=Clostridium sp. AM58-1XD TaxID=2292307 RepID=UPI000E4FB11D|nr:DMT family transporter [Clostridium sp. AM58-1XD]RGY95762.1 DMT family transporter [Clostridium sp. AM58-1XD]
MNAKTKNIIAMSVFGTLSIFVRNISLSSLEMAFWRGLIAITVLFAVQKLIIRQPFHAISRSQKLLLLFSGMAIGLNWVLLFMAYEYTSVAAATLAYYFAPVIVMALCPLLFKEKMTLFQFFCFLMATTGLFLVIGGGQNLNMGSLRGILYGLGAACFYASVILMNKFICEGNGLERTVIQFAGAIALLFIIIVFHGGFHIQNSSLFSLANLLAIGILHTGICYCLYFSSIKELKGQQTAILSYIDPFVAILVSVFVFHEPVQILQGAGAVLILGFTCLYELKSRPSKNDYAKA